MGANFFAPSRSDYHLARRLEGVFVANAKPSISPKGQMRDILHRRQTFRVQQTLQCPQPQNAGDHVPDNQAFSYLRPFKPNGSGARRGAFKLLPGHGLKRVKHRVTSCRHSYYAQGYAGVYIELAPFPPDLVL
eukprot:GHVT01013019.1.p2 GENE.GHVT01013019.1~~GHVT01013019.1.p2  ORF type:complete len:133 (+),score=15.22 GHVT01013019.1:1466-1864(+)